MDALTLYKSPFHKFRVGRRGDGGYVIANQPTPYKTMISGGISNDISFEAHMLQLFPSMECIAYDGTIPGLPAPHAKIQFVRQNIGDHNSPHVTDLKQHFQGTQKDIFLKLDIEGHEFRVLPGLIDDGCLDRVSQMVIEFHSPHDIQLHPNYYKGLADITNDNMFEVLRGINKTHTLVHVHPNNATGRHVLEGVPMQNVFECTYIHNDLVSHRKKNTNSLPVPGLDQPNHSNKQDVSIAYWPFVHDSE